MKTKLFFLFAFILVCMVATACSFHKSNIGKDSQQSSALKTEEDETGKRTVVCETDCVAILKEVVESSTDIDDVDVVSLFIKNKTTGAQKKLLTTVKPEDHCWYECDGNKFYPVSIDSITAIYGASILSSNPLKILVEGCPDARNVYSYLIDVESRKAWYIPANNGFLGETEEGYLIFQSYRYVSDPEIGGRYTFIQVFDPESGKMVDSLDLEHLVLEKYKD